MHTKPIPRIGGIAIIFSLLIGTAGVAALHQLNVINLPIPNGIFGALLLGSALILLVGGFDDSTFVTVRVRHKVTAELLIAISTVYFFNIHVGALSLLGFITLPLWASKIISFFWILGITNAFNIIDGLDGLAGSIAFIATVALLVIAAIGGELLIVLFCAILAGSLFGFLFYNVPPAKVFLGDTGSLFLGCIVAILSLYLGREVATSRAFIVLPLVAGIPILEVLLTMVRRYFKAKDRNHGQAERLHSMVIPDNSHLHHRFLARGYSPLQSTTLIAILAATLSCGAIALMLVPSFALLPLLLYLALPVIVTLDRLGFGGRFKKALGISRSRYTGYVKQAVVGVIDKQGTLSQFFTTQKIRGISCIPITEKDIPGMHKHLRAAVMQHTSESRELNIKRAEAISSLLCGPVYVVEPAIDSGISIFEVSKNGSLRIAQKEGSLQSLAKDLQGLSHTTRLIHHNNIQKTPLSPPPAVTPPLVGAS